jgi:hypothetical protein
MQTPCSATTAKNEQCRAPARPDSTYCFWHAPELAVERMAARSKGGKASHEGGVSVSVTIRRVSDLLALLETAAADAMSREPSLARARTLCHVATTASKVLEIDALEGRITALETAHTVGATPCN